MDILELTQNRPAIQTEEPQIADLFHFLQHELTKAYSIAKMYLEIFDEIAHNVDERSRWNKNLVTSLEKARLPLTDLSTLYAPEGLSYTTIDIATLLAEVNQQIGINVYQWQGQPSQSFKGDLQHVKLCFVYLFKYLQFCFTFDADSKTPLVILTPGKQQTNHLSVNLKNLGTLKQDLIYKESLGYRYTFIVLQALLGKLGGGIQQLTSDARELQFNFNKCSSLFSSEV